MATTQARTRATAAWRARNGAKLVQAYLHTDTVARLDALVAARGASGRAVVLAELIEAAHRVMEAPVAPQPEAATTRPWRLTRSTAPGWQWDVLVDGKLIGRVKPPEIKGGNWAGMTPALPGPSDRRYRRTRDELAGLLVELAS